MKRIIALLLVLVLASVMLSGCGGIGEEMSTGEAKVKITIGNWPNESQAAALQQYENYLKIFNEKYPNIEVQKDEWKYDVNSFLPKAASGQLPTRYSTFFTEPSKIIDAGYACDITDTILKYGYETKLNPKLLELVARNGRYYGLPGTSYAMGLACNVDVFRQAGEVDENDVPNYPRTYTELAELAKRIKDKTGKAGFAFQTTKNEGGWLFMNIAWSFGTVFEKQEGDKWIAAFNSPEGVEALQFIQDLKWKYGVWTDNVLMDRTEFTKRFAMGDIAMGFDSLSGILDVAITDYGMKRDDVSLASVPSGTNGKNSLLGGSMYMFSPTASLEQIDAVLKWMEVEGYSSNVNDELKESLKSKYAVKHEKGQIVLQEMGAVNSTEPWINKERINVYSEVSTPYVNVDMNKFNDYLQNPDVKIRTEEPQCTQELYKILDSAIQQVLTDKNADPKLILDKAADGFQKNYLDKI